MIRVYWLDCSLLYDPYELERVLPCLSEERRTKVLRIKPQDKRAQSAGAGLLLRHLFGDKTMEYGEHGKPYISPSGPYFSVSHSGSYVVCAVSDFEIGVDIQSVSPVRLPVLRRCFTTGEQSWIGDDAERFTRLWTMKEAYLKFIGTGLSVPAKEIVFSVPPSEGYDKQRGCHWFFPEFFSPISICANSSAHIEMISLNMKDLL